MFLYVFKVGTCIDSFQSICFYKTLILQSFLLVNQVIDLNFIMKQAEERKHRLEENAKVLEHNKEIIEELKHTLVDLRNENGTGRADLNTARHHFVHHVAEIAESRERRETIIRGAMITLAVGGIAAAFYMLWNRWKSE